MNTSIGLLLVMLACQFGAGCASPVRGLHPPAPGAPATTVYVLNRGWHTGLALPRADLHETNMPVVRDFPGADYLEFGWGDAAFYTEDSPSICTTLKAVFWPTPSVLHVAGARGALRDGLPAGEIVAVQLSEPGFERLRAFVADTFRRDQNGNIVPAGPGLYGEGRFYQANGKFYFPKMCNRWTASGLRAAGCPIAPGCSATAGRVMSQARTFGEVIR